MALARALAVEPKVLLLDEPFGALDATVRKELREWLRRLHDEVHVTTIFVTHDQEEAMEVAEQIVVMNEGRIEQVGTPREIYDAPANDFVMKFVGPVTRMGEADVRPHDLDLLLAARRRAREEMQVKRIVHLGFEIRVDLETGDGRHVWAQLTRVELEQLELQEGQLVYVRPSVRPRPGRRQLERLVAQQRLDEVVVAPDEPLVVLADGLVVGAVQEDRADARALGEVCARRERGEGRLRRIEVALLAGCVGLELRQLDQPGGGDRGRGAVARLVRDAGLVEVPVRDCCRRAGARCTSRPCAAPR